MKAFTAVALALAAAQGAMAALKINNWTKDTFYWYTNNDDTVHQIGPGISNIGWDQSGASISIKMSKHDSLAASENDCMQFEYNFSQAKIWYDLSLINGNPFGAGNVKISPTGAGSGAYPCNQVKCDGGVTCHNAYINPDDNWATHNCPDNVGDIWVDIGEPTAQYNSRSVQFSG